MGKAIYQAMGKNDPGAVWVLQTWIFLNQHQFWTQPRIEAFLGSVSATYPARPVGDSVAMAMRLWEKHGDAFN